MFDPTTAAMIPAFIFMMLLSFALPVAVYVLSSIGLYRMAKSCNLASPGLAWVPIANLYILGSIAEIGASRGVKKSMPFRKILPGLSIAMIAVVVALFIAVFAVAFAEIMNMPDDGSDPSDEDVEFVSYTASELDYSLNPDSDFDADSDDDLYDEEYDPEMDALAIKLILVFMLFYFALIIVAILLSVFEYIALWHVYKLFDESNAVLYLLLSIFVSIAMPVIYFILGRKTPNLPVVTPTVAPAYPYETAYAPVSQTPPSVATITAEILTPAAPAEEAPVSQTAADENTDQQ